MTPHQVIIYFGGSSRKISVAARELKCTVQTIYNWLAAGEVPRPRQLDIQDRTGGKLKADRVVKP